MNFQVVAPGDSVDLALDVIADQMVNSHFAAEKVDKERRVVLEELNGRLTSPSTLAVDLFLLDVFGDHPARNHPAGNRETVGNATREVLLAFRDSYFVASNMVVAVVGDVRHEDVFPKLATAFEGMRTGSAPAPIRAAVRSRRLEPGRVPRRGSRRASSSVARRWAWTTTTATSTR